MSGAPSTTMWLEKATMTTPDITGPTYGGMLSPAQARQFLRVAIDASPVLSEVRNEFSASPKFEVPRISFGARILRPGTEGTRNQDSDRIKGTTGLVTLSTVLLKGEVPISDEIFEDNIERDAVADTVMTMIAEAVSRDIEELILTGDTARTGGEDTYRDLLDGLVKQAQSNLGSGQKVNCTGLSSPESCFSSMVKAMPARYRPSYARLRLYVPVSVKDAYQDGLAGRGSALGDSAVSADIRAQLAYRGIKVVDVPMLTGTDTINSGAIDYSTFMLLVDPANIIVGWHRQIRIEKWRDPREGATSFIPTCRVDVKYADPNALVFAYNVPAF